LGARKKMKAFVAGLYLNKKVTSTEWRKFIIPVNQTMDASVEEEIKRQHHGHVPGYALLKGGHDR